MTTAALLALLALGARGALLPELPLDEDAAEPKLARADLLEHDERELYDRLRAGLALETHHDHAAAAALDDALRRLVKSPTARGLAQELLATGEKPRVSFEPGDCAVYTRDGRSAISGIAAKTATRARPPQVKLCRGLLDAASDALARDLVVTLPHELLGHALEAVRARRLSPADAAQYESAAENETNASLVGWVVGLELGAAPADARMRRFLDDPDKYLAERALELQHYAGALARGERNDPAGVLRARLARLPAEREKVEAAVRGAEKWRAVIEHFVSVHGAARAAFAARLDAIERVERSYAPGRRAQLDAVEKILRERLSRRDERRELVGGVFLAEEEKRIAGLRARLARLLSGKPAAKPGLSTPIGQFTRKQLVKLYEDDLREHPEHWPASPRR